MVGVKILFVVNPSSIHSARWINQFSDLGWEIHITPGTLPFTKIHPEYKTGFFHCPPQITTTFSNWASISKRINFTLTNGILQIPQKGKLYPVRHQAKIQSNLIKKIKPDIIHTLGLNINWENNCISTYESRKLLGNEFNMPWVYSTWGTDLDFFTVQSDKNHYEVQEILPCIDYLITECKRDELLAYSLGFRGRFLGYFPAFGGIPLQDYMRLRQPGPVDKRRLIFLKGRDQQGDDGDPVGRAMTAMDAFKLCEQDLKHYTIVISQASKAIIAKAEELTKTTSLKIQILPYLPYNEILKIIGSSRVFIALTVNDGLPSSLVEAMALGSFPIHSDLEPIQEWIIHKKNGLLITPENPEICAEAIRKAINEDSLVNIAAEINTDLVEEHLKYEVVKTRAIERYKKIVDIGSVVSRDEI